ncbi:hypothetical protein HAX54_045596, partial [Datura stramonium]|nr:hypothetical protein [Datura stramonium]
GSRVQITICRLGPRVMGGPHVYPIRNPLENHDSYHESWNCTDGPWFSYKCSSFPSIHESWIIVRLM